MHHLRFTNLLYSLLILFFSGKSTANSFVSEIYFPVLFNISADSSDIVVLVDKASQKLFLITSPAPGELSVIDTFNITTGREKGNKQTEGDHKTPEGIYYIVKTIPGELLPPRYGPLALVLNYPNFIDRLFYRTGSNIWIHGRDEDITGWQTEGCISLENNYILDLYKHIRLESSPVIIVDSLITTDSTEYAKKTEWWKDYIEKWRSSWETGDMTTFFSYYSDKFKGKPSKLEDFKKKKKRLESIYAWKDIQLDKIVLFWSQYETHIYFYQKYLSPFILSKGYKKLTLLNGDSIKIVNEDFKPEGEMIRIKVSLMDFLNKWKESWEKKDLNVYSNLYDDQFISGDHNKEEWLIHKADIFSKTGDIRIKYKNVKISSRKPLEWKISFIQYYSSGTYEDKGRKTLTVKGYPGDFKIIGEEWESVE